MPLDLPAGGTLRLLAWHATPPVFDGPEDRNGRRNHDEAAFWLRLLDGALPYPAPAAPFVLLGDANLDPARRRRPAPRRCGPCWPTPRCRIRPAGRRTGLATADFSARGGPGGLRVDYVLPSAGLTVDRRGRALAGPDDPLPSDG